MGCQKQIAKQIIERNADYILALKAIELRSAKGLQGDLFADVQQIFAHAQSHNFVGIEHTVGCVLELLFRLDS